MLSWLDAFLVTPRDSVILFLFEAALKATIVLAISWVLCRVLRKNTARVRHWVWSAALIGVLIVPVVSQVLPHWRVALLPATERLHIMTPTPLEKAEGLEQLRALENGHPIRCAIIEGWRSVPVDVPADVDLVEAHLARGSR